MPHKCPICEGKGKIKGFYPDVPSDQWEDCRACHGRGVIQEINLGTSYPVPAPYPVPYPQPVTPPWQDPRKRFWYRVGDPIPEPYVGTGGFQITSADKSTLMYQAD